MSRVLLERFRVPELARKVEETYVERARLERAIEDFVGVDETAQCLVVVGPRGSGKRAIVRKVLRTRNVVYVQLSDSVRRIADAVRAKFFLSDSVRIDVNDVFRTLGSNGSPTEKPVVVLELDSQVGAEVVTTESHRLQRIVCEDPLAHGILVLSDAHAALELRDDPARRRILWVGDFDDRETDAFLDKFGVLSTHGEAHDGPNTMLRRRLVEEVGANPALLYAAAAHANATVAARTCGDTERLEVNSTTERAILEDFVRRQLDEAADAVERSMVLVPVTKRIVRALLASRNGAIRPSAVRGLDHIALMADFHNRKLRAISYNSETNRLVWSSKAHEAAAGAYFDAQQNNKEPSIL